MAARGLEILPVQGNPHGAALMLRLLPRRRIAHSVAAARDGAAALSRQAVRPVGLHGSLLNEQPSR